MLLRPFAVVYLTLSLSVCILCIMLFFASCRQERRNVDPYSQPFLTALGHSVYKRNSVARQWCSDLHQGEERLVRLLGLLGSGSFRVIDVGANVGRWLGYFERFLGSKGPCTCDAFEPGPGNLAQLQQTVRSLTKCVVKVYPVGAADRDGKLALMCRNASCNSEQNSFDPSAAKRYKMIHAVVVPVVDVVSTEALTRPGVIDILKVDVEGLEWRIVRHILSNSRKHIRIIHYEATVSPVSGQRSHLIEQLSYLQDAGYAVFRQYNDLLAPVSSHLIHLLLPLQNNSTICFNIVAIHRDEELLRFLPLLFLVDEGAAESTAQHLRASMQL